tara:strand:+ start:60 stop:626 length:567 start_codon:yes stop_codon:yes gene_type:complete
MKIHKYTDYDEYVAIQTLTNKAKESWTYASARIIDKISADKGLDAKAILCHGTRSAGEQKFFRLNYPNAYIMGTEISDSATKYPMTIQHDFMEPLDEFVGRFDIIYSNSFDHSIRPAETLQVWMSQLGKGGTLYLEYAEMQSIGNDADPLDATAKEIEDMITGGGFKITGKITEGVKHAGVIFKCENQ